MIDICFIFIGFKLDIIYDIKVCVWISKGFGLFSFSIQFWIMLVE